MPIYKAPVEDVNFLLNDVFQIDRYDNLPGFQRCLGRREGGGSVGSGKTGAKKSFSLSIVSAISKAAPAMKMAASQLRRDSRRRSRR